MSNSPKGQSLDGDSLDLSLLDHRVLEWKTELGLLEQPEFPPKNVRMSEDAVKFHDRSHILVQDYLGKTSYELRETYNETSLPPVYEELLTFFFAKVAHHPELNPEVKTTPDIIREDILLMRHLGYIDNSSIFIKNISNISVEIGKTYRGLISQKHFPQFKNTLLNSTKDSKRWEELEVLSG